MSVLNRRAFLRSSAALAASWHALVVTHLAADSSLTTEYFSEVAQQVGIDFTHFNGMSGQHYYPEMVGSGAALFDYDNDGDLDILIVQGQMLGAGKTLTDAMFPPRGPLPLRARLYRNDSVVRPDGSRTIRFTDVTEESRIDARGYGMGVAAGDYNNDGWVDLYITNLGHNQMWRNNGDGTFTDVTQVTGTDDPNWSVSAAFVDFDHDGWLDLFVGNYVDFSFTNRKKCFLSTGVEDYCGPLAYEPVPNRLFRNRRNGTFEDVTGQSQIARESYGALGVVCADFNGDGLTDIYVANDERSDQLWINQGNGTFKNRAMLAGCAVDRNGRPQSSMGVDAGDFDNNGTDDLVVANLMGEYAALYVNDGKGMFEDRSFEAGLGSVTVPYTGFGIGFIDYDNDGWLDIFIGNGEVKTDEAQARAGDRYPLKQKKLLLHNLGNGRYEDVSEKGGAIIRLAEVSRGVAFGDVDNDGDTDILVVNNNGPARLLINNIGHRKHWLGLRMVGEKMNRDMLGTRVGVFRSEGPPLWRRVHTDGSYASANDPRVLVGLGDSSEVTKVRAQWVSGRVEEWIRPPVDRYVTLREGSGRLVKAPRK
jgi:enediyne biosynthesis protein E4